MIFFIIFIRITNSIFFLIHKMLIYSYIFLKIDSKSKTNINIDINKNETYGLFINYKQFCIYVDATALQK